MANEMYHNKFIITYQFWMYKMCLAPDEVQIHEKKLVHI
jgi:hypothetical protein